MERITNQIEFIHVYQGRFGVPIHPNPEGNFDLIRLPNFPHVFSCSRVGLFSRQEPVLEISNAVVMMAHGYVDDNDIWRIVGSNEPVEATYCAYSAMQMQNPGKFPPLDVVIICNPIQEHIQDHSNVPLGLPFSVEKVNGIYRYGSPPPIYARSKILVSSEPGKPTECSRYIRGGAVMFLESDKWANVIHWQKFWDNSDRNLRPIPNPFKIPV